MARRGPLRKLTHSAGPLSSHHQSQITLVLLSEKCWEGNTYAPIQTKKTDWCWLNSTEEISLNCKVTRIPGGRKGN